MNDELLSIIYSFVQYLSGTTGGILIWIMGLIMLGSLIVWIIKKLMNRCDEEDEEDPKDEIGLPEVPFEEAGGIKQ